MADRRRRNHPEPRNNAHAYMQNLRGEHTNTLFIGYSMVQGTLDPSTPGVFNNPSTVVFTFNGTSCADHFIEYFHFQKATSQHVEPAVIQRVASWILEDFHAERRLLPDYVVVLRDQVRDEMAQTVENEEFEAFKEGILKYASSRPEFSEWAPRFAFGLAPWRPEHAEPLVYLYQNDNVFLKNEEFQNLIVNMFITIRVHNYRFSVLEPLWTAENSARLWTKVFPSYAAFTERGQNRRLPRVAGTNQFDFDTITLQFHTTDA